MADDTATPDAEGTVEPTGRLRRAAIVGVVVVVALAGLAGWLGFRAYESHRAQQLRDTFLEVGRQGALNLTNVDWEHADDDVQRVLDSATGTFYDDFQKRAESFTEVVKQAKSKSVGTIDEVGLESASDNEANVLVAVTINTSNAGAPEQAPQHWRMQLTVQKIGDEVKVSKVDFSE
ncbi:Mce protein [[Mycobacterium] appelbergii]|uniref:Mce protein n=1 Tax=[Mycobacterium] appelbergii TaxID=2939269 RepID=UPI0029393BFE|nr:Mce protein [Mycobacterium sp. 21AC1]